jgi:diaminopimelate epimerase
MAPPRSFEKYEGLGNDFVVVDVDREDDFPEALAARVCDRRFGVGGDGVLLVLPARQAGHAARMKVINADGSVPEMCGNGLRCVALHAARARGGAATLTFETGAGPLACAIDDDGSTGLVEVDMGVVVWTEDLALDIVGERVPLALATAGNPHAVTFELPPREVIDRLGPRVATHPVFPRGTNVEFARVRSGGERTEIDLVVWERGCGVTMACGTGACATVAVACEKGLAPWDEPVTVHLPGGPLTITMRREDGHAIMRGPARHVFSGTFDARLLAG